MLMGSSLNWRTVMDLAIPWILAHMIDEVVPQETGLYLFYGESLWPTSAVIALLGNVIANRRA